MQAVRAKIDDYFARCRLVAFDERALTAMNRQESEYLAIAAHELTTAAPEMASFPLARVTAEGVLPLSEGINPAWDAAICRFTEKVVGPQLGNTAGIAEGDWIALKDKFAGYEAWLASKSGSSVERLGIARVRQILVQGRHAAVRTLIASDKVLEAEANAISSVDKLVRFHRDLGTLLNNFVSFRAFYQRRDKAVFQVGTLYLDQRSCDLCVRVDDIAKHAAIANLSMAYLAYCELTRKGTGEKMLIAAAFTDGESGELAGCVLLNTSMRPFGAFYERLRPRNYSSLLRLALVEREARRREATILRLTSSAPQAHLVAAWARYSTEQPVTRANLLRQLVAAARYRAPAQRPHAPMLALAGGADRLVDPRCSVALAEHWALPIMVHPSAGHYLTLDDGAWVSAQIEQWLRRTAAAAPAR